MAQVRTRKRGKTWSYIFEAGNVNGKRKVVEKGGFPTKADAYKAGVSAYTDFLHGNIGITSESITLKDFMTNWLDNVVALSVKASSMQTYQTLFKNHITPNLSNVKVQDLTPAMLDKWIRDLQRQGLAYNTISSAHTLIHHALDYAVYPAQLISSNPANYIKVPKNALRNVIKRTIITLEQFKSLLEKYPFGTPLYIPLLLLYHTGMRIGEVLGLTWSDIDFKEKKITVSRQVVYLNGKQNCLTTPKTESSNRTVFVSDFLLEELARWHELQAENEAEFGDSYVYSYLQSDGQLLCQSKGLPVKIVRVELICTRSNGGIVTKNSFARRLSAEGFNSHSFRHTHATRLIELGATPKGVATRLGHSNVQITQNLYTHNTDQLQRDTAGLFEQFMQTTR